MQRTLQDRRRPARGLRAVRALRAATSAGFERGGIARRVALVWTLSLSFSALGAQDATDATEEATPAPPRWHLRNGSRLGGTATIAEITVETRYGTLRVPLSEVVSVRFAPRLSASERERVGDALRKLAGSSAEERADASALLKEIGPAVLPILRTAIRAAAEPEVSAHVEAVYADILGATARARREDSVLDPLFGHEEDQILTRRFRIHGLVLEETFRLQSPYGELEIARSDLAAITFDLGRSARAEVDVDALRLVPENWLRTAVEVSQGDKLSITASGQLNQPNYGIICGPEGTTRYSGSTVDGLPMLSLVGKIGRRGKPFLIGRKLREKTSRSGDLYLGIVPFRRNYVAQGKYDVRITVNP